MNNLNWLDYWKCDYWMQSQRKGNPSLTEWIWTGGGLIASSSSPWSMMRLAACCLWLSKWSSQPASIIADLNAKTADWFWQTIHAWSPHLCDNMLLSSANSGIGCYMVQPLAFWVTRVWLWHSLRLAELSVQPTPQAQAPQDPHALMTKVSTPPPHHRGEP